MRCPVCPVTTATCISFERSSELMIYTYLSRDSGVRGAGDVRGGVGGGLQPHPYDILLCFSMPRYFKKEKRKSFKKLQPQIKPVRNFSTENISCRMLKILFPSLQISISSGERQPQTPLRIRTSSMVMEMAIVTSANIIK